MLRKYRNIKKYKSRFLHCRNFWLVLSLADLRLAAQRKQTFYAVKGIDMVGVIVVIALAVLAVCAVAFVDNVAGVVKKQNNLLVYYQLGGIGIYNVVFFRFSVFRAEIASAQLIGKQRIARNIDGGAVQHFADLKGNLFVNDKA